MKHRALIAAIALLASLSSADVFAARAAKQKPAAREPDMCVVPPGAQPLLPAKLLPGMGTIKDFAVTTKSEDAQKFFLQGLAQIHSFWFVESERSCLQAAQLDPEMAMAYWCMALSAASDYRPAFQLLRNAAAGNTAASRAPDEVVARTSNGAAVNPQIRAREAIARAMELREKVTPRERLYIESQAARRAQAPKDQADAAYIAGLRKLVAAYPDDLHAKSMLGLAIDNGFEPVTREPREHTMEAIALLNDVVKKDDDNFAAQHYLIHAWEGSKTPENAWHACERYPQLVPNIPHALHMPGHIYAQSDKIAEAVAAFTAARANELTWIDADTLYPTGHHGHNVHFLIHSLNLSGRYHDSMAQVQHLMSFKETPRDRGANNQLGPWRQGYFGLIKSLVRFEKWNDVLDGRTIPVYDKPEQNAWRHWATGLAFAATGQSEKAKAALGDMHKDLDAVNAAKEPMAIAAQELEAIIAAKAGDRKKAYELYRKAADREAAMIYTEPPSYPRPVVEGWANVALAAGDYATAETAKAWANADPNLPQMQRLTTSAQR
ncbi:MAG: hypothetical protein AUI11_03505 [Acidobacteria bacterium 13_2_20CM_2_66_4]|nr:MAG: hypothetical protein AUI11_03505 [Acidobacteria bacterium 13_2_20CM_2_66_4]